MPLYLPSPLTEGNAYEGAYPGAWESESKEKMYLQSCCMIAESEAALRCWDSIVLDSVVFINR